jgi:hypothetical protein
VTRTKHRFLVRPGYVIRVRVFGRRSRAPVKVLAENKIKINIDITAVVKGRTVLGNAISEKQGDILPWLRMGYRSVLNSWLVLYKRTATQISVNALDVIRKVTQQAV